MRGLLYFEETGGNMGIGFACLSEVESLGGGLYRVYFGVYGEGEAWNAAGLRALAGCRRRISMTKRRRDRAVRSSERSDWVHGTA